MSSRRPVPVILNPTAGGGRLLRQRQDMDAAARHSGIELGWWTTDSPGHATELARRAAAEGHAMVFAFGGDGTYNEVARGLLGSVTAMAVLPGGTTSVLAYELAIPRPAATAVRALAAGHDRAMRVGLAGEDQIFILMLSAGPDTLVLERLAAPLKKLGGKVGVAVQAVVELLRWQRLPRFRLRVDGTELDCGWVIVGNSRCYAGPFQATPDADPFTPGFQVVALKSSRRWPAICFALGLPFGRHIRRRDVVSFEAQELQLHSVGGAVTHQIDGDVAGELPVKVSVHPQELVVRVPNA